MTKFIIRHESPEPYRDVIIRFWKEYLPGTPSDRFEWHVKGNPAGQTDWFFAFEDNSHEPTGMISVLPKEVYIRGEKVRLGVVGDFMVSSKYRVFGPTFKMVNELMSKYHALGYDALYTIPNNATKKIMLRAGFKMAGSLFTYVRPVIFKHYLGKKISPAWSLLFSPLLELLWKMAARETYRPIRGRCEESIEINECFDNLLSRIIESNKWMLSDRSSLFLRWRYADNPEKNFRFLFFHDQVELESYGYAIYQINGNRKLIVFDFLTSDRNAIRQLIKELIKIACRKKCISVETIGPVHDREFSRILKGFRFINSGDTMDVLVAGEIINFSEWRFMSGDRNI